MVKFIGYHNPATYASLPDLADSKQRFEELVSSGVLKDIGQVLIDHKVEHKYGLALIHKHFDMGDQEALVESVAGTKAVSIPWSLSGDPEPINKGYFASYGFQDKNYIRAHAWVFSGEGELSSYEYFQDVEQGEEPPKALALALFSKLKEYSLANVLGLRLHHYSDDCKGFEKTDDKNKANVIEFIAKSKPFDNTCEMIDTCWMFDKDSDGLVQFACFFTCSNTTGTYHNRTHHFQV